MDKDLEEAERLPPTGGVRRSASSPLRDLFEVGPDDVPPRAEPETGAARVELSAYCRSGHRVFDRLLLALTLPVIAPLTFLVWIANAASHRSLRQAFFLQPRTGLGGETFSIFKFRTMKPVSDGMQAWSTGEDRLRVTRLGRFLRCTHLDELPQILNILRGEMRFIGPRPEMVEIVEWACEHVPDFHRQLAVKPGITGLAQITQGYVGRDPEGYATKLEHNLEYIRRASLWLDVSIVFRTAWWMLRRRGWSPKPADVD